MESLQVFPLSQFRTSVVFSNSLGIPFGPVAWDIIVTIPQETAAGGCNRGFNLALTTDDPTLLGQIASTVSPQ
jgi:hypothetical protein